MFGVGKIADIADAIIDRAEGSIEEGYTNDACEAICDALNDELIYTNDQWEVMKAYQEPANADFNAAIDDFINDLVECVKIVEE